MLSLPCPGTPPPARDSPSSALCCGVTASSLLASLAIERVMRPLRLPWLLAVLRPLEATASFSSLSSPEVSSVFSLKAREGDRDGCTAWQGRRPALRQPPAGTCHFVHPQAGVS